MLLAVKHVQVAILFLAHHICYIQQLIDDSLNLARAGRIDYETAFEVVLSMEHETEYAPWKAFIRNMNFLRKRLVALVEEDEDLDPDIYLVRNDLLVSAGEIL